MSLESINTYSLYERNQDCTLYIGNIDQKVNENILWELFIQCGPVVSVTIPKDKITKANQGFAFLEFRNESDCDYAIKIMNLIKLYGKPIKLNKASTDKRTMNVGANIYVGNLSLEIEDKYIRNLFCQFGSILNIKLITEENKNKQHALIDYSNFESSDNAVKSMNNQLILGRRIKVEYALKPNSKSDRYGSLAERLLASKSNDTENKQLNNNQSSNMNLFMKMNNLTSN